MNVYLIVLRFIHITSAVAWAGTTFFLVSTLIPSAIEAGPDAGRFLGKMAGSNRMIAFTGITATLTALSGVLLYGLLTNGFHLGWLSTGRGLFLTIGGLAGLAGWGIGVTAMAPVGRRLAQLITSMESAGAPPTADQIATLQTLREKQATYGTWLAILLALAVTCMSVAEYIIF
jgi:uncharacterized membrane protein